MSFGTTYTGTVNPQTDLFRFNGVAGQKIFLDAMATNGPGAFSLWGPNNQGLVNVGMNADFEYVLPQSGQYVLAVGYANLVSPGAYSIKLITPSVPTNALTLGATVTGALTVPGQEDRYVFNGTAGQNIYYDALENDFGPVNVYLYDPFGNNVNIANNADSDVGPFRLATEGKYTLLIK